MNIIYVVASAYHYFTLLGTAVHEISHWLIIKILPGIKVTEFSIFSHVNHKGRYTATRMFLISYAPLFINTTLAYALFYSLSELRVESVTDSIIFVILFLMASSIAIKALPSYIDAVNPLRFLREGLFTIKFPLVLLLGPIFVAVSIPFIILGYIAKTSVSLDLLTQGLYLILLVTIGFGIADPALILEATINSLSYI